MRVLSSLSPLGILRQLHDGESPTTFNRLGASRHVADLRLIFSVTLIIMIAASILALMFCFEHQVMSNWQSIKSTHSGWIWPRLAFAAVGESGAFIGAVGAVGCGVLAWTYQTGSSRLGVVDLFACEIATLCRVAAVADMVPRFIARFDAGPPTAQAHKTDGDMPADCSQFSSQESYFPVFDSSVKDLQPLEADIVDNVTAFYTYMKIMRDALRRLATISASADGTAAGDEWHRAVCNVIYMQFLGLESARKAIAGLVEYAPTRAENILTILLSELTAYGFLREQFKGELKERLLAAREEQYRSEIRELGREMAAGVGPQWERVRHIAAEVMLRCGELFPTDTTSAARVPELA